MSYTIDALLIGAGATVLMDLWGIARTRLLRAPAMSYGLVGRWLAYLLRGRFRHSPIAASPPVRGELLIGWTAHYAIGIAFAATLLALFGSDWACYPTLGPALLVGIVSVAAPFPVDAAGHGRGHRGEPHSESHRGPFQQPAHAHDLRPRPVRYGARDCPAHLLSLMSPL